MKHSLSVRETQVVILYVATGNMKKSAVILGISPHTMKAHCAVAKMKADGNDLGAIGCAAMWHHTKHTSYYYLSNAYKPHDLCQNDSWLPANYNRIIPELLTKINVTNAKLSA